MTASPQATLVAVLMASMLLGAHVVRPSMPRAGAHWTVLTGGLVGYACAALHASMGW